MSPEAAPPPAAPVPWHPLAAGTAARKKKRGLCARYGCLRKAGSHKRYCCKHHHQALKRRDPISYIYSMRKQRAKARGHAWTLTLPEFRQWCEQTGYHLACGRRADAASIDRIDPSRGYCLSNLACIPYGANSAKSQHGAGTWSVDEHGRHHYHLANPDDPDECPF